MILGRPVMVSAAIWESGWPLNDRHSGNGSWLVGSWNHPLMGAFGGHRALELRAGGALLDWRGLDVPPGWGCSALRTCKATPAALACVKNLATRTGPCHKRDLH